MKITKDSYFLFSGGEVHATENNNLDTGTVTCLDYTMNGFMALCEFAQLRRNKLLPTHVIYPYFPYARQDRYIADYEPFNLKVFCDLLNSQKFDSVKIYDPHSDVVSALIDNCKVIHQWDIADCVIPREYLFDFSTLWVSPDSGAFKKVSKLARNSPQICIGVKIRDEKGEIILTKVYSPVPIKDKTCVIVDDICDGGRTFIELAKVLKAEGAKKIVLYVTHGIFSKGLGVLKEAGIDHIYTTNSFSNYPASEFLTIKEIV